MLSLLSAALVSCGASDASHSRLLDSGVVLPSVTSPRARLTDEEKALVAYLVSVEAQGYPYEAQVCLCAVILNRLSDAGPPDTVRGVVFDSGDFEAVSSGRVSGQPPHAYTLLRGYSLAMRALEEALSGVDPTGGAMYFTKDTHGASHGSVSYSCGGMQFYL